MIIPMFDDVLVVPAKKSWQPSVIGTVSAIPIG